MPGRKQENRMPTIIGKNISVAKALRLSVAFGRELDLGRDATVEEIDTAAATYLRQVVDRQEESMWREQRVKSPLDLA